MSSRYCLADKIYFKSKFCDFLSPFIRMAHCQYDYKSAIDDYKQLIPIID